MVLLASQVETTTRYLAKIQFLQIKIKDIVYPSVILTPTIEAQIAKKDSEIGEARRLSGLESWNHDKYVSIVAPLKLQLYTLQKQNRIIIAANQFLLSRAESDYQKACVPKRIALQETEEEFAAYLRSIQTNIVG